MDERTLPLPRLRFSQTESRTEGGRRSIMTSPFFPRLQSGLGNRRYSTSVVDFQPTNPVPASIAGQPKSLTK